MNSRRSNRAIFFILFSDPSFFKNALSTTKLSNPLRTGWLLDGSFGADVDGFLVQIQLKIGHICVERQLVHGLDHVRVLVDLEGTREATVP